ncbi:MAG: M23 family metallopeptidase, partial [Candidatus Uhrbacteria bacterium]|nr:M23 family metallopeptidase [Candidatus Uhrbacteria bacterium]
MKRLDVLVICALTFCLPSFALAQVFSTPLEFDHFGRMFLEGNPDHLGVDLMNGIGTAVYACGTGKVHRYEPSIAGYGGCDGQAGEVLFLKLQKNDGSTCVVQYGHVRNVPERLKSPNASVTKGEYLGELANYDPCCGGGGSCPHLHYGVWNSEENLPNEGWGYGNQGHWVEPFEFTARQNADWYVQDRGLHSVFGHYKNDPHWYHAWTEAFRAHPKNFDGTAKNCLIQEFEGGPWGGSVVYDPVGGGRRAYIVGWWQWSAWMDLGLNCGSCPHPDGHSGSSGEGGPNSCLGMPITNSYLSGPNWRQDFQKGYILDDQVWCYPSRAPGWASDDSWH